MIEKYENYIWQVVNKLYPTYVSTAREKEEAFQNGAIGIMEAMKGYDPLKGRFTTYCTPFLKKEIGKQVRFVLSESSEYLARTNRRVKKAIAKIESEGMEVSVERVMKETGLSGKIVKREMKIDYAKASLEALSSMGSDMRISDELVVNDILKGLLSISQKIVKLKAVENWSFKKIARYLNMSEACVKKEYASAIEILRSR